MVAGLFLVVDEAGPLKSWRWRLQDMDINDLVEKLPAIRRWIDGELQAQFESNDPAFSVERAVSSGSAAVAFGFVRGD